MPELKRMLLFILRFVVLFGLLVAPWPGFREHFARALHTELRAIFHVLVPGPAVEVRYVDHSTHKGADTEICRLPAAAKMQSGQVTVTTLVCDSRSLGWMPHAMILALCAATRLRWSKWWKVSMTSFIGTHLLVCATFMVALFSTCADDISSPLARWLVMGANHILVDNLWASFVGPFLLWIVALVVFGCSDELMFGACPQLAAKSRRVPMPHPSPAQLHLKI